VSRPRRAALLLGGLFLLALVLLGAHDFCAGRTPPAPRVVLQAQAEGPMWAGAATHTLDVPLPATVAGYGVPRATAHAVAFPVRARALVLESGAVRVGLVSLDVLVGDDGLDEAIAKATASLGLTDTWVTVTHTHSGPGGYAENPIAQLAGTGLHHRAVEEAVVQAAASALQEAAAARRPVTLRFGEVEVPELVGAREPPPDVDARLSRLVFLGPGGPVAQLLVFACHPTLVQRPPPGLDSDWPGRLADAEGERGHGVTLVLQGAVGNASPAQHEENGQRLGRFVAELARAADALPLADVPAELEVARIRLGLPGPDAHRLVPALARPLANNLLCAAAPAEASVGVLRLGPLVLLGVPGEPSAAAARVLEAASGAHRVVSLVNGYLGYVETPEHLAHGEGEAERQLLAPGFLEVLEDAARAMQGRADPKTPF
jgi:neutral ceramidase